ATQEELFHTFNTLHLEGKQIILSGNCPPLELKQIEPRLISRFEWGIVLPLEPLDEESLHHLLLRKTKQVGIELPSKTENFLVSSFHGNASSIVRAIDAISLRSHMQSQKAKASATLNVPQVKELLKDLLKEEERSSIKPEQIVDAVAAFFEIESQEIFSKSQARAVSFPRHIAMYLCKDKLKMPYTHIGRFFSRDHSTIMTNIAQIQKSLDDCDPELENIIHAVTKIINQSSTVAV
ncbi:MAG: helix-turn-helix domain-containing protein, partial [Waddliaceae bacterium]